MADVILLFWLGTDFLEILYSFFMWFLKGNLNKIPKVSWICCGSDYLVNLDYGNWLFKQENDVKILSGSVKTSTILWHCLNWHIPLNFDLKAV